MCVQPTVQEVATLSSDNRQLRDEVEKGRVEIIALMKKLQHLQSKVYTLHNTAIM